MTPMDVVLWCFAVFAVAVTGLRMYCLVASILLFRRATKPDKEEK